MASDKLGPHYIDAIMGVRAWEVYRLNLDLYAGQDEADENEIKEKFHQHMKGVRAVRGMDMLGGRVEDHGFYEQLRRSAVWASSQLPEAYVEEVINRETSLDTAKVVGVIQTQ